MIPAGTVPVLDGIVSVGEWDDALALSLAEDTPFYAKHAEGLLVFAANTAPSAQVVGTSTLSARTECGFFTPRSARSGNL